MANLQDILDARNDRGGDEARRKRRRRLLLLSAAWGGPINNTAASPPPTGDAVLDFSDAANSFLLALLDDPF